MLLNRTMIMGRPKTFDEDAVVRLCQQQMSDKCLKKADIARTMKISRRSVLRILSKAIADGRLPPEALGPTPIPKAAEPIRNNLSFCWT